MGLIYITGIAGAGKSTVCEELASRGFDALEPDGNISAFYHNETGEMIDRHVPVEERTLEWREHHTWKMSTDALLQLKSQAADRPVFICGVAANEDEYIGLFDQIFALTLDLPTVLHRVETRATSDFGKSPYERAAIIEWQKVADAHYHKIGAYIIDATKPPSEIADEILANLT